jgi:hypothetical protein
MPAVRTPVNCPSCRQSIIAEIERLFDVGVDPTAKQRLLSGQINNATCPFCGFNGMLATPVVYHDPDKEMLITFFPAELAMARDEQERVTGSLINQVINNLEPEKRKGYLFNPQSALTLQSMMEQILEADGVTREMLESQQKRVNLLQRMMTMSDEVLEEVAKSEDEIIDQDFYTLLTRLIEASMVSDDKESAKTLSELQDKLLPLTTYGQQLKAQTEEVEAAVKELRALGDGLTREKLLEIFIAAPNKTRLNALVSLTRPGIDYEFFTLLSERIDKEDGEEQQRLIKLREDLLQLTSELDKQIEARVEVGRRNLEAFLSVEDIPEAVKGNLAAIDDFFIQVLGQELENARESKNTTRFNKLQQVMDTIREISGPAPEIAFIQDLLETPDDETRDKMLNERSDEITEKFVETLTEVMVQFRNNEDKVMSEKVRELYRTVIRKSMRFNIESD